MNAKEIIDLANSLSNDDLGQLIAVCSDRLCVAYWTEQGTELEEVTSASINGTLVQINTLTFDNVLEDE